MPPTPSPYSVRVVARHPELAPWIFYRRDEHEDPWARLDALRTHIPAAPNTTWPLTEWTITMALTCPHCGDERLVEIAQSHRGDVIQCSCCGKAAPVVRAAGDPSSSSPKPAPSRAPLVVPSWNWER